MSDQTKIQPSPMRMMRAWLFRERAVRGPNAIELDVVDRQITREERAVGTAAGEAATIERRLHRARQAMRAAITDKKTPGVIDADETRVIARALVGTSVAAHHHTERLEALT
jgi:hypothetical protein